MARIRTVKPEFWTNGQVMECSPNARLLFIGLWNFCDDKGRHPFSPKQIKAQIFPSDEFSSENVRGMVDELIEHELLSSYSVDGKAYIVVTGWHHQKIDKPQDPKYPSPPNKSQAAVVERSSNGIDGKDRIGRDRIGKEKEKEPRECASLVRPAEAAVPRAVETRKFTMAQFAEFWTAYPDKTGKGAAEKAFEKISKSNSVEFGVLMDALARYKLNKPEWKGWCNPSTWLTQRRWEDEPNPMATGPPKWAQTA